MADRPINELPRSSNIKQDSLFCCQENGQAMSVTGQVMVNDLASMLDGHGGIHSSAIVPGPGPLDFTLRLTLAKTGAVIDIPMKNGRSITGFWKAYSDGLTDIYTITYNDDTTSTIGVTNGRSIQTVKKTGTVGLEDTYTITYNDGSSSKFAVKNGAKGDKGDATYTWIKFASTDPSVPPHSMGDLPAEWIGFYWGPSSSAPKLWSDYQWYEIKGAKGDAGDPATLVSATTEYQVGSSGTVAPSGEWLPDVPPTPQGRWLWSRTTYRFNSGDPVVVDNASYMGMDGLGTANSVDGVNAEPGGNIPLGAWRDINGVKPNAQGRGSLLPSDIGAASFKLLWRNESPSSAFPAQDISIPSLEGCTLALIVFADDSTYSYIQRSVVVENQTSFVLKNGSEIRNGTIGYSNTFTMRDASINNSHLVPIAVFGFKS